MVRPVQALAAARPDARITRSANWCGFPERFCCVRALDPLEPLFQEIGSEFIKVGVVLLIAVLLGD